MRWLAHMLLIGSLALLLSACGLSNEPPAVSTIPPQPTRPPATLTPVESAAEPAATEEVTPPGGEVQGPPLTTEEATSAVTGSVSGTVTNGTAGGSVPAGLTIQLHTLDQNMAETVTETPLGADGTFSFANVSIQNGLSYVTTVAYQGRIFNSAFVVGDPANPALTLPITIYDLTADVSVIEISSLVTQVFVEADQLQVAQIIRFNNKSDRLFTTDEAVAADQFASIKLDLPAGATILGFNDASDRFLTNGSTVIDTMPVQPGTNHVIHVVYSLPFSAGGTTLTETLPYPLSGMVHLMATPPDLDVVASFGGQALPSLGQTDSSGSTYAAFGGPFSVPASTSLRYSFQGGNGGDAGSTVSTQTTSGIPREMLTGALLGGGAALIVFGAVLLIRESQQSRRAAQSALTSPDADMLIAQLAALDEAFAAGKVKKGDYEKRRADLKAQIAQMVDPQSRS